MKITFIIPPPLDQKKPAERTAGCTSMVYPMINIYELTVAALLEKEGFDVAYADFVLSGKNEKDFIDFIRTDHSTVYCFWSVNLSIETDKKASEIILKEQPDAFILYIGPAPTLYSKQFLTSSRQIVVRGEPDETAAEVCRCIASGETLNDVKGISYFTPEGQIKNNPTRPLMRDLDILPFPARHLIDRSVFSNPKLKKTPYTAMVTSRNCPFRCIYCVPSSLTFARELENKAETGKKPFISMRSPENVIAEIEQLAQEGYKAIGFQDDNFIITEARLKPIAEALKKHDIIWGCQARADAITENIARILGNTGCHYVDLGVESFDDDILQYIQKNMTSSQIFEAIELLNHYKVPVKLNILIGTSPLETKESIRRTLDTAKKVKASQVMINIVAPFPGTEFYQIAKENGWIEGGEYIPTDVQRNSILNYPNLSSKDMEKLLFRHNISFFLRPKFIFTQIRKFSNFSEFWRALKALKTKLIG